MITESGFTYVVRYEEATYGAHFGSLDLILYFCGQMPFGTIIKDNFKISHPFGMNPLHIVAFTLYYFFISLSKHTLSLVQFFKIIRE